MLDKNTPGAPGILQLIATVSAKAASGRLDIAAGVTEGFLFFRDGKLLDARIGDLTGFQAINAVASIRDVRYHFDPAARIPDSSSITMSERVVLKQFFGIETVDPNEYSAPAMPDESEEATVVTRNVSAAATETVVPHRARSAAPYVIAVAVSVLVVALVAAAVVLRSRFRERTLPASVATANEPVTPLPAEPTIDQRPTTAADRQPTAVAPDLTGKWTVVNTVNATAHGGFQNLQIGFALSINQTGHTFTAQGQKVSENGRSLPASSRTPIQLKGFIDGDRVEANFSEQGALRRTNGRFVWKLDRAGGGLRGTFASTAARSSGKSTATREL
ncbi:MAG TPA: DUF4388 domain-containing protein [Pyrinomonadaceae bacterium]|nr:DUF4388 domain-containing protein [Pyrinomonadaceae bacterium]